MEVPIESASHIQIVTVTSRDSFLAILLVALTHKDQQMLDRLATEVTFKAISFTMTETLKYSFTTY
jgi:hypothetical protein